jgi:hypothetical protein
MIFSSGLPGIEYQYYLPGLIFKTVGWSPISYPCSGLSENPKTGMCIYPSIAEDISILRSQNTKDDWDYPRLEGKHG